MIVSVRSNKYNASETFCSLKFGEIAAELYSLVKPEKYTNVVKRIEILTKELKTA